MGLISRLFRKNETRSLLVPGAMGTEGNTWLFNFGTASSAGVAVTPETALQASAVLACVGRIARDLSTLPLQLRRRSGERVTDHPVARLLRDPNPYATSAVTWQAFVLNHLCYGNGHLVIERVRGRVHPVSLLPIIARDIAGRRVDGELKYQVGVSGAVLGADSVVHVPYLAFDGVCGQSPIRLARDVIGTSIALDRFAAKFFANGANVGTVFELPEMKGNAIAETRKIIQEQLTGADAAWKPIAIPQVKVHKAGMSPKDAQAVEARDYQVREIARIFGIPVGIIDPEKSKYAGLEAQQQDYAQSSLRPVAVAVEQELQRKLLTEDEQDEYTIKWNLDALVRASLSDRMAADSSGVQSGILTPNEARAHHDLAPIEGGDRLLTPLNLAPADQRSQRSNGSLDPQRRSVWLTTGDDVEADTPEEADRLAADAGVEVVGQLVAPCDTRTRRLVDSIAVGIATKEANAARKAAQRSHDFAAWAVTFFDEHLDHVAARLPSIDLATANRIAGEARAVFIAAHDAGELDATLEAWPEIRPNHITLATLNCTGGHEQADAA